jgi:hypothetical protein
MPDWTIKIVPSGSGKGASFAPGAQAAQQDDLVCWNNTTKETHQPWPTDENYNPLDVARGSAEYLSDAIPPGQSSRPSYDVAQPAASPPLSEWTVYYYCAKHPNRTSERGTIVGSLIPDS